MKKYQLVMQVEQRNMLMTILLTQKARNEEYSENPMLTHLSPKFSTGEIEQLVASIKEIPDTEADDE